MKNGKWKAQDKEQRVLVERKNGVPTQDLAPGKRKKLRGLGNHERRSGFE